VKEMVSDFIFADIFLQYQRFFKPELLKEKEFLYDVAMGFLPRRFDHTNVQDKIIYEEDQEVCEMYFVLTGHIGYAINALQMKSAGSFYKIGRRQKGRQLICDHYAINKRKSKFIYLALDECDCFALSAKYMEIEAELRSSSYTYYKTTIYRPLMNFRTEMIKGLNRKKKYEKIIDLRHPVIPDELLNRKYKTNRDSEMLDLDLNKACDFWQESLIGQGRLISNMVKGASNNFDKIATEIEARNII
jgi:hypothetical protein